MYCTVNDVRLLSGLTTSEISDADLVSLISYATAELNGDINYIKNDEIVSYIDSEKENKIDGSNTTFYLLDVHKNNLQIGDYDNDGDVDTSDFYVYTIDNEGTRSDYTVSTLDDKKNGKITLSSAPSTNETLYVTYSVAPLDEDTPDTLIKQACAQLTAALAFTKIDAKKLAGFTIGKVKVTKQSQAFQIYYDMYKRTVEKINQRVSEFQDNISD